MKRRFLYSPTVQKRIMKMFDRTLFWIMLPSQSPLFLFFASMNLEGLASIAVVLFGAHIGYTSLLFNRARAFDDGPLKRRTLIAAELGLRATLVFLGTAMVGALAFALLVGSGYKPVPLNFQTFPPLRPAPTLVSFLLVVGLMANFFLLRASLITLVRRDFGIHVGHRVFARKG